MSVLRLTRTQAGFDKMAFGHFLLDRTGMTLKQTRVAANRLADHEAVDVEIPDYNDQDFSALNNLRVEFELLR